MINAEELKECGPYEYVSRHYWEMEREELKVFVQEAIYVGLQLIVDTDDYKQRVSASILEQLDL